MKLGISLLILSIRISAAPLFWEHPNVSISLAEPSLPFGQVLNLNLADLAKESPQSQIWFTGGLVGYFTTEWKAPIWTVMSLDWRFDMDPADEPQFPSPQVPPPVSPSLMVPSNPTATHTLDITSVPVPEPPSGMVIIWLVGLVYGRGRLKRFLSTR